MGTFSLRWLNHRSLTTVLVLLAMLVAGVAKVGAEEIGQEFKSFFSGSGGVPVMGNAVSPRVIEGGRLTQYTERQRIELHPDNAGPYQIMLGRLGSQDARQRGLMDSEAFQPRGEDFNPNPDCLYFDKTGQQVCNGFKEFWQDHGADLGDEGVSARESIALFGYPISREFVDPDTGLTVQYFERARFEYHEDGKVMLGRLGSPAWDTQEETAEVAPEPEPEPDPAESESEADLQSESEPEQSPEPDSAAAQANGGFIWPTEGTITQKFGHTSFAASSGGYGPNGHSGLDISNAMNTPIKAAKGGTITVAGWSGGYGYAVAIDHGNGTETWYGHMPQQPPVSVGQQVSQGQVIGSMGSTGFSTGPHLHFEVRTNGNAQDPLQYLP